MIKSMTGYGRSEKVIDNYEISVEMKSVNHRYADYNIRVPRSYSFLEEFVKSYLQKYISRGKTDVFVSIKKQQDDTAEITLNKPLAESYVKALRSIAEEFGVKDDISVSTVARYNDIFEVVRTPENEEKVKEMAKEVLSEATAGFIEMREREGKKLADDMVARNDVIRCMVKKIDEIAPTTVIEYRNKIEERIRELIADAEVDETRLLTETAIYADKLCINEEIVRLTSHLDEFDRIMGTGAAVGRKLDFLLQEMNRETNTIGSKSNNLEIAKLIVEIKSELEKIREQLQNIE